MNKVVKIPGGDVFNFGSFKEEQEWCSNQVRRKGFTLNANTGTNTQPIDLPGDVRAFIGIVVFDSVGALNNFITLTINSSIRIEAVSQQFLCRALLNAGLTSNPYTTDEVFPVPYPLTGKDDIVLQYQCGVASTLYYEILYI